MLTSSDVAYYTVSDDDIETSFRAARTINKNRIFNQRACRECIV